MIPLRIYLLDSFHVEQNGRPITDFATDKARALLAYLVMERRFPHRREQLAALLWPNQEDDRARQSLRQALSNLRHALDDSDDRPTPLLLADRHTIQLNPRAEVWVDAAVCGDLSAACQRHRHRALTACLPCLRRLEELVCLYAGDFLAGFLLADSAPFEEWALIKREWLHCQAVEALTTLADFYERRGDLAAARQMAQRQAQMEPWREEAHRQLMRLLAADGRRSAALSQYEQCRRALLRELGAPPTNETMTLYAAIREDRYRQAEKAPPEVVGLAPPNAPFVGRLAEQKELAELLACPETRLITLLGPGGIGKTRLAMETAVAHLGLYADGVYWLELAAVPNAPLVIPSLAQRLGLTLAGKETAETQLLAYLRAKQLLLILDNAEHLPELTDLIAAWLARAPGLTLLVTSRERLNLREEQAYELAGLAYAEAADAAQLFNQAAQRRERHFAPNATELTAVDEICRLVEGIPLALELAAAWTLDQSCAAIARALREGHELPAAVWRNAPARQQSMQTVFTHSWKLLTAADQLAFARLACFRGGFTAAAAQAVAETTAAALGRLADKSLLRRLGDGRYQLHELLRQFAEQKLADFSGEAERTAAQQAAYYLAYLSAQESDLKGSGQETALAALDLEMGNIRQAWAWATEQTAVGEKGAAGWLRRGLESLYLFHALRSWYQSGAALFARAAAAVNPALPEADLLRGELLTRQARCLEFTAPPEEATALYQESLAHFAAAHASAETALPLCGLGYMAYIQGDYAASETFLKQSLARYQAAEDDWGAANALSSLCQTQRRQGDFAAARQSGAASLSIRRRLGDRRGIASAQNHLAFLYCAVGEHTAAEAAWQESATICQELGHTVGVANAYTGLCQTAFHRGEWADAAHYQREALRLYRQVGDVWGEAIAYNNLGQLTLTQGDAPGARDLLQAGIARYRELGMKTGLAHSLSNLGQVNARLGDQKEAARCLHEALSLATAVGDRPIALEALARAAVLWGGAAGGARPYALLTFIRQQPELLQETRSETAAPEAAWRGALTPAELATAAELARSCSVAAVTAETLALLQEKIAPCVPPTNE